MIFIKGIGFSNKGAELMLHCILRRLRQEVAECPDIMATGSLGSADGYRILGGNGVFQRAEFPFKGNDLGRVTDFAPRKVKNVMRAFGIAVPGETKIVLDASGLSYSDRFGEGSLSRVGPTYRRVKRKGGRVILLPQAFGPLTVPRFQDSFRQILRVSDLAYARDPVSRDVALRYCPDGEEAKINCSPDLTIGENFPEFPENSEAKNAIGIVLNFRLTEQLSASVQETLFDEMRKFCLRLRPSGRKVVFILHEGVQDLKLCEALAEALPFKIPILKDSDPRILKNTIGSCRVVIAQRYHACVGALSQGVPCFGMGWNHKYRALFKDFHSEDTVMDGVGTADAEQLGDFLGKVGDFVTSDESIDAERARLITRSVVLADQVNAMWATVLDCIRSCK